jgi:hypothetical protein
MMINVRVHLIACLECGHMTNFQKWSKYENRNPEVLLPESVGIMS